MRSLGLSEKVAVSAGAEIWLPPLGCDGGISVAEAVAVAEGGAGGGATCRWRVARIDVADIALWLGGDGSGDGPQPEAASFLFRDLPRLLSAGDAGASWLITRDACAGCPHLPACRAEALRARSLSALPGGLSREEHETIQAFLKGERDAATARTPASGASARPIRLAL